MKRVLLLVLSAAWLAGCGGTSQPYVTPERLDKGLVIVLTGIHGRLWLSESICHGLAEGGVDQAIEIYDWTWQGHWFPFYNLGAIERNHRQAQVIAAHVVQYRKEHPGRPVTLVGYSGGGPLAVWTAEALPAETRLDGIVLLAAPLTPQYDLRPALRASRKGAVSFYSPRDVIYLAMGTLIFGTMDKHNVVSAGNVKFVPPATAPAEYERLFQIAWQPPMSKLGYDGSHLTIGAKDFVAQWVAPLVKAKTWEQATMDQLGRK